ncbi:hypothetical protein MHH56_16700 [Paenibacillus sp. FSL K6-3182]|uniref:hypothetical protein n=1 Tax=Paenibacillus sp. FSL K6-3182 TaxID=2921495 RepID=UPI0030D51712
MEETTLRSNCQIERIGEIIELSRMSVFILINEKRIEVPLTKVAEDVSLGDFVVWTGSSWNRKMIV